MRRKPCSVLKLLIQFLNLKSGSVVCIYAVANWYVCSCFITDCLLVFNTLIFDIYISLVVFAVVFLIKA